MAVFLRLREYTSWTVCLAIFIHNARVFKKENTSIHQIGISAAENSGISVRPASTTLVYAEEEEHFWWEDPPRSSMLIAPILEPLRRLVPVIFPILEPADRSTQMRKGDCLGHPRTSPTTSSGVDSICSLYDDPRLRIPTPSPSADSSILNSRRLLRVSLSSDASLHSLFSSAREAAAVGAPCGLGDGTVHRAASRDAFPVSVTWDSTLAVATPLLHTGIPIGVVPTALLVVFRLTEPSILASIVLRLRARANALEDLLIPPAVTRDTSTLRLCLVNSGTRLRLPSPRASVLFLLAQSVNKVDTTLLSHTLGAGDGESAPETRAMFVREVVDRVRRRGAWNQVETMRDHVERKPRGARAAGRACDGGILARRDAGGGRGCGIRARMTSTSTPLHRSSATGAAAHSILHFRRDRKELRVEITMPALATRRKSHPRLDSTRGTFSVDRILPAAPRIVYKLLKLCLFRHILRHVLLVPVSGTTSNRAPASPAGMIQASHVSDAASPHASTLHLSCPAARWLRAHARPSFAASLALGDEGEEAGKSCRCRLDDVGRQEEDLGRTEREAGDDDDSSARDGTRYDECLTHTRTLLVSSRGLLLVESYRWGSLSISRGYSHRGAHSAGKTSPPSLVIVGDSGRVVLSARAGKLGAAYCKISPLAINSALNAFAEGRRYQQERKGDGVEGGEGTERHGQLHTPELNAPSKDHSKSPAHPPSRSRKIPLKRTELYDLPLISSCADGVRERGRVRCAMESRGGENEGYMSGDKARRRVNHAPGFVPFESIPHPHETAGGVLVMLSARALPLRLRQYIYNDVASTSATISMCATAASVYIVHCDRSLRRPAPVPRRWARLSPGAERQQTAQAQH
ncbi:hypothetical protein C8R45DRAFT_1164959 [Mycena sanguinolenta]|nr:hypothetical protein C8R45DRAFT_1164959 [Mycena sanguinolenta]